MTLLGLPLIKYSEIPKDSMMRIVIMNITDFVIYRENFIRFKAFFPDDDLKRPLYIIFPKYRFLQALSKIPVRDKNNINNVLIEFKKILY